MAKKPKQFRPNCVIEVTEEQEVGEFRLLRRVAISRDLAMQVQSGGGQTDYYLKDDIGGAPSWFSSTYFPGRMTPSQHNTVREYVWVEVVPGTAISYTYETQGYMDGVETPYDGDLFCEAFQQYVEQHAIPLVEIECRTPAQARTGSGLERVGSKSRLRPGDTPRDVYDLVQDARAHATRFVRGADD